MKIFTVLVALVTLPLVVADQDEDRDNDFIRFVISFNPQLLTPDIDIPILGDFFDLPIFSREEGDDVDGSDFSSLIESIATSLGTSSEPINFFSISATLNIDVRRMPPLLARFIETPRI